MVSRVCKLGCTVAVLLVLIAQPILAANAPFLVVHKKIDSVKRVKDVEDITVSIGIYNAGGGSAYDVTLDDETWPEAKFSFKKGNGTGSWEKLVPQGSVSTSYVVTSSTPGMFVPPAAKVTFRDSSKPSPQTVLSSPPYPIDVLRPTEPGQEFAKIKELVFKYGPFVVIVSAIAGFIGLLLVPDKKGGKGSKRR
eukprot:TRINITY_DN5062_c0_g1_i1.p1 TRINITY_DN5062_c0_g1~~TRINITY_DN5062_c0_g1_i1.p1  ORF type:complete len:194 (-),score=45.99 TRINITY_DN5062_c0_g1_i1:369-950(-)